MTYQIQNVAIMGAGVMGAGIAAHIAEQGLSVILFDRKAEKLTKGEKEAGYSLEDFEIRNRHPLKALTRLKEINKNSDFLQNISVGNFEDDINRLVEVDWIIEVIIEDMAAKENLFEKIEQVRRAGTIVSTNTSGLSVRQMVKHRTKEFKRHFLGTHFFNPPQYLKLLEVIPTSSTDPSVIQYMKMFCSEKLRKGVVIAKDTPNFIANRLGTYGLFESLQSLERKDFTVGEIDSVTGSLIGRPKTATFKTADIVGIDTLFYVAQYMYHQTTGKERELFILPSFIKKMVEADLLGEKTSSGFYKNQNGTLLEIDVSTLDYVPINSLETKAMERAYQKKDISERINIMIEADDRAGKLIWEILSRTFIYAGQLLGEIADDMIAMDNAMKWGFGWEMGIFETWDAIGVAKSITKMESEGMEVPFIAKELLKKGYDTFYKKNSEGLYYFNGNGYTLWTG